ncbi:MAG: prenyltransferase [Brooklawnia sp.]|uniref:prenyltransferase n=1 Tax=Brooklawnia sp. TaxID=2699740 RepID=UPI003C772CBE
MNRIGSVVKDLVLASRPLSWVNTAYPFAMAWLLATGRADAVFWVGVVFFLIPYNLLMYGVNDVFDYESDLANPRKGGVEGALLQRSRLRVLLWTSVLLPVPGAVWLLTQGDLAANVVLVVVLFAVVAYSAPGLRFKERPVLDSATSATHFVGPAVYGWVLSDAPITASVALVLAAFFAWGMASQAFGAVQDIAADRQAGIGSVATVLGARRTIGLVLGLYATAALLLVLAGGAVAWTAVLVIPYLLMVLPFRHLTDPDAEQANRGWRRFLWINYAVGAALTIGVLAQRTVL